VSDHDTNRDEMALNEFTEADEELARFADEVRTLYAKRAGEPIEQAQLDAIVEAAEDTAAQRPRRTPLARQREAPTKRRPALPRKRLVLLVASAALGVALLVAGLAAAGVSLPGSVHAPLDRLGIQPPDEANADSISGEIDFPRPDRRGYCSFGRPIAAAANVEGTAVGLCSSEDANGGGEEARSGSTGRSLSQSPLESARRSAPPREQAFGDPRSPLPKQLDQGQGTPPSNRPDQGPPAAKGPGQQTPPADNRPDQGPPAAKGPGRQTPPADNGPDQGPPAAKGPDQQTPPAANRPNQAPPPTGAFHAANRPDQGPPALHGPHHQTPLAANRPDQGPPPTGASHAANGPDQAPSAAQGPDQQTPPAANRSDQALPPTGASQAGNGPDQRPPAAQGPDQQTPPAENRPDQGLPPTGASQAANRPDQALPPTGASQSQSGGQIAPQRSQQIGQQQLDAAQTDAAQTLGHDQSQVTQIAHPSSSVPPNGQETSG
jgi:hypothetical protein